MKMQGRRTDESEKVICTMYKRDNIMDTSVFSRCGISG